MNRLVVVLCLLLVAIAAPVRAEPVVQIVSADQPVYPRSYKRFQLDGYVLVKGSLAPGGTALANVELVETDQNRLAIVAMRAASKIRFTSTVEAPVTVFVRTEFDGKAGTARFTEVSSPDTAIDTGSILDVPEPPPPPVKLRVAEAPTYKAPGVFGSVTFKATLTGSLELENVSIATGTVPNQFQAQALAAVGDMKFSGNLNGPIELVIVYGYAGEADGSFGLFSVQAPDAKPRPTIQYEHYADVVSKRQAAAAKPAVPEPRNDAPFDVGQLPDSLTTVELIGLDPSVLAAGQSKFVSGNRLIDDRCMAAAYPFAVSRHYWNEADRAIKAINDAQTGYGARSAAVTFDRGNFDAVCASPDQLAKLRAALGNDVMAPRLLSTLCEVSGSEGRAQYSPPPSHVMNGMGNICINLEQIAQDETKACMRASNRTRLSTPGLTVEEYCKCSGERKAEYFSYGKTALSSSSLTRTATMARSVCDNRMDAEAAAKRFR